MLTLAEARTRTESEVGAETHRLAERGARGMLIPARFEESYYRHANLPEQLRRLFANVNPRRIDEDALEPLTAQAQALVRSSALLDDSVQVFYRAVGNAGLVGGEVHAHRPGSAHSEAARVTPPGTAALHAVKRLWARDWAFAAVLERLETQGSVALEARPTLLLASDATTPGVSLMP